jgi:adenylosuccinate synthase
LLDLGVDPILYAHPNCVVTTFADMIINQRREDARGDNRHGSVGVGIHETMRRSVIPELKITMSDLWNNVPLESRLQEICNKYAEFRTGKIIENPDDMIANTIKFHELFASSVNPLGIQQCKDPVFEGAQGLLLDQDNKEFFPHLTHSKTGLHNVRILCQHANITDIDAYYVSRTYLTRHGAGKLPNEDSKMNFEDNTNVSHPYQGKLRFAPLDVKSLKRRIKDDAGDANTKIVLTHCDQFRPPLELNAELYAYGPMRTRFTAEKARVLA